MKIEGNQTCLMFCFGDDDGMSYCKYNKAFLLSTASRGILEVLGTMVRQALLIKNVAQLLC